MSDEIGFGQLIWIALTAGVGSFIGAFAKDCFAQQTEKRKQWREDRISLCSDIDDLVFRAITYWSCEDDDPTAKIIEETEIMGKTWDISGWIPLVLPINDHAAKRSLPLLHSKLIEACTGGDFQVRGRAPDYERLRTIRKAGQELRTAVNRLQ